MPGQTSKHLLPYPIAADAVADGEDVITQLAQRLDLLLGETGTTTITPSAANTTTTKRVNYSRSYGALAPVVPRPFAVIDEGVGTTLEVNVWTSAEDASGFTLNIRASDTQNRAVKWLTRP